MCFYFCYLNVFFLCRRMSSCLGHQYTVVVFLVIVKKKQNTVATILSFILKTVVQVLASDKPRKCLTFFLHMDFPDHVSLTHRHFKQHPHTNSTPFVVLIVCCCLSWIHMGALFVACKCH